MSEEKVEQTEEKPKKPIVKIIILAVVVILLMALAVAGTLFATGAFSKKAHTDLDLALDESADSAESKGHDAPAGGDHGASKDAHGAPKDEHGAPKDAHGAPKDAHGASKDGHGGAAKGDVPQRKALPSDKDSRFEKSYMDLDDKKALVANVAGSRKVMQVNLSLMTTYDDRVFKNVEKHRAALRSGALDVLRQTTEADLTRSEFRAELAVRLREKINSELERLENFGGIEEVFFTEFVFQ